MSHVELAYGRGTLAFEFEGGRFEVLEPAATGSAQFTHLLVRRLVQLGVAPVAMRVIFATGIHRRVTREEKAELLTPFLVQRVRTLEHDAADPSRHVSFGETERGTPIELDR